MPGSRVPEEIDSGRADSRAWNFQLLRGGARGQGGKGGGGGKKRDYGLQRESYIRFDVPLNPMFSLFKPRVGTLAASRAIIDFRRDAPERTEIRAPLSELAQTRGRR
jgi:hypothetical protein